LFARENREDRVRERLLSRQGDLCVSVEQVDDLQCTTAGYRGTVPRTFAATIFGQAVVQ
jgi:hypothetical protein